MKSVCINLDRRTDKWEAVQPEFDKLGLSPERFSAVVGSEGSRKTRGVDGCRLSHLECMANLRYEGVFTILEDDVLCCIEHPKEVLDMAMNELPDDWDALWLGANLQRQLDRHSEHLFRIKGGWTTHAIVWNNQNGVVDYILEHGKDSYKFDVFLADDIQEKFKCYIPFPMIATQKQWDSDIMQKTDASVLCRNAKRHMQYYGYIKE